MANKIRLLFYGDAPTVATGFGTVSRNILMGLHNTGKYDISVMGVNYWGDPHPFPFPIWPIGIGGRNNDPYGRQRASDMMMNPSLEFDALFMIQDSFILEYMNQVMPHLKRAKKFASVCYFPVDGVPKSEWIKSMDMFDTPVTYTEFARKEATLACPEIGPRLKVIPHGANTNNFYPTKDKELENFKKEYFGRHASKFIVTNVNRNQQRKDIPRTIMAFKEFHKRRPNSVLYLHMAAKDQGWDIPAVVKSLGLTLNEDVLLPGGEFGPNQGFPIEIVNLIYNSSDVVVSTTVGEGWGLSTVEAMACKIPVVFPDNTALTEIVTPERGYLVRSGATPSDYIVMPNDNDVVRPLTNVMHMAETLLHIYDNREEARGKAEVAYNWVKKNLVWEEHIVPQWDKLIMDSVLAMMKKQQSSVISAEEL